MTTKTSAKDKNNLEETIRMKYKWLFGILVGLLIMAIALPGCAPPAEKPPVKDTLIIASVDTSPGIDIDFHTAPDSWRLIDQVYPRGLDYQYEPSGEPGGPDVLKPNWEKVIPSLFESWELSGDGTTATFGLKKGVYSFYGNEFTTKDVLWKYERAFGLAAVGGFFLGMMDVPDISAIKIIDDYTFSITAARQNALLIPMAAHQYNGWFDSTEATKHATDDDPWATEWIKRNGSGGLGPYVVDEWIAGDRVVLKANPRFHAGEPSIKTIVYKVIPESSSRLAALRDGTIDVAYELNPTEIMALADTPGVRTINLISNADLWGMLNNDVAPFDNKLVRQALNYAVPRKQIVETAYLELAHPWTAPFPLMFPGAISPDEFPYTHDIAKAKELLTQAGHPDGFTVELAYDSSIQPHETAATIIKSSLAEIGITVELKKTPPGAFSTQITSRDYTFALYRNMPIVPDPNYCLLLSYYSPFWSDFLNYLNPEVDKLLEEGQPILDPEERIEHHKVIQRIILDDAAMIWLVEPDYTVAIRDNIEGWNWNTTTETRFDFLSFSQ